MLAEFTDLSRVLVRVVVAVAAIYVGMELFVFGAVFVPVPGNGPLFVTVGATTIGFAGALLVVFGTRWFYRRLRVRPPVARNPRT